MLSSHYDYRLVALSVFIAICAAYAALGLAERVTASRKFKAVWIAGGACAMGTAIWSMHYIGMLAFQLPVAVHYDVPLVLLSMLAAILASVIALLFTSRTNLTSRGLVNGAVVMGAGIAIMHYIGMAAMRMRCTCTYDGRVVALSVLIAVVVSGVALTSLRYRNRFAGGYKIAAAILLGTAICSMHYTGMAAAHFWRSDGPVDFSQTVSVSWLGGIGIATGTLLLLGVVMITSLADQHFTRQSVRLRSTEERYRVLFERSLAGIYRATLDGKVIDMNHACVELLGYNDREEVLGRVIRDVHMREEDQKNYVGMLMQTKRLPAREIKLYRTDGSVTWVMHSATLLESEEGAGSEIQGMLLSIDQLKRTEMELRTAKRAAEAASLAKSQFLANMSHELRTPFNGILGMMQILADSELSAEQKEYVELVRSSAESLLALINHILDFSVTGTATPAANEEFDLRDVIGGEIAAAETLAQRKKLKLRCDIAPEVKRRFHGEPHWIRQILSSLLNNALRFTAQGEVAVIVRARSEAGPNQVVSIEVQDTGIGISRDQQMAIFEPFSQADNSNKRRFGGTGLGLSIVRNLTEAMGGQISLHSQPGKGSTFSVVLPMVAAEEDRAIPNIEEASQERYPHMAFRV
ncbi:MAG: PAS domain S-box protein [Acidobacteriaceae bacterium]|nr:PAS domain S-box protein [Acidobacteriaceae bacterium]